MSIVQTDVPMTSQRNQQTINNLIAAYPFLRSETLTQTAYGRPILTLSVGNGPRKVLFTASHHANEWITTPVILKFVEDLAAAMESDSAIAGVNARELAQKVTIYTVPMVNPDGVDLVTGAIQSGPAWFAPSAHHRPS